MNTPSKLRQIRTFYERKKGSLDQIHLDLSRNRKKLISLETNLENSTKAQEVIHIVAKTTQEELQYHLSDIVSLAMSGVFPDPYSLIVDFISRRGKVEVDMDFEKGGHLCDPLSSSGGGAVDIAALALRFSSWALRHPRTRPIIILDEPMKWLKGGELPVRGAEMIREISQKLGLQIIMVSHDPELIDGADKIINVSLKKGISRII